MNFVLKKNIKRCIASARTAAINRKSPPNGLRILMYHSVGGIPQDHRLAIRVRREAFEEQLAELKRLNFESVTVSEAVSMRDKIDRSKLVALTFDDGYEDNFKVALPLLKKVNFTATFFVTISYIDGEVRKIWSGGSDRRFMSWDEIRELAQGGFEIGSHMVHHIGLSGLSDKELAYELKESKDVISKRTDSQVKAASFPYGRIDERAIRFVKDAGYGAACSSFPGLNAYNIDIYKLKRTEIDGYDIIKDFRRKIYGYYDW